MNEVGALHKRLISKRPTFMLRWCLYLLGFSILSTLIFAIPVLAEFGKPTKAVANAKANEEDSMLPRSGMLIPLYIYPTPNAWDPLFAAVQAHPSVDFIIVINPASGPGPTPVPDVNYAREITKLNDYPNVRTIGYVAVNYGRKALDVAFTEVDKYSVWGETNPQLAMQGIFIDESPQIADEHNSTYLERMRHYIKGQKSLADGLLVMNPGMIPDGPILAQADKTVVFEERYQTYVNLQAAKQLAALPDRSALVCLMHSIPPDMPASQLKLIVSELRELSGSIFLTEFSDYYYSSFSPRFSEYIDAMT